MVGGGIWSNCHPEAPRQHLVALLHSNIYSYIPANPADLFSLSVKKKASLIALHPFSSIDLFN